MVVRVYSSALKRCTLALSTRSSAVKERPYTIHNTRHYLPVSRRRDSWTIRREAFTVPPCAADCWIMGPCATIIIHFHIYPRIAIAIGEQTRDDFYSGLSANRPLASVPWRSRCVVLFRALIGSTAATISAKVQSSAYNEKINRWVPR